MEVKEHTTNCYQRIYMEYAPMLLRFAGKFVSGFFAEDIVHDVFLKLWDKQVFLLPDDDLKRILYVAVRNACIDHLRRLNMEQEILDHRALQLKLEELDYFESSDELFMRKDLLELLMKKVEELPGRSQEIFRLSYLNGMKAAEILPTKKTCMNGMPAYKSPPGETATLPMKVVCATTPTKNGAVS